MMLLLFCFRSLKHFDDFVQAECLITWFDVVVASIHIHETSPCVAKSATQITFAAIAFAVGRCTSVTTRQRTAGDKPHRIIFRVESSVVKALPPLHIHAQSRTLKSAFSGD